MKRLAGLAAPIAIPVLGWLGILGAVLAGPPMIAAHATVAPLPAPALLEPVVGGQETAIFAGGCFWGVQGVFSHVKGVASATAGYAGGAAATAHYEDVSTGATGHAEAVRVVFDPRRVNYAQLLRVYFAVIADPTTLDRQGPDEGSQYRSALFPLSAAQAATARAYIGQLTAQHTFPQPIVTTIEPDRLFYPAEAHHQDFLARHPESPYIAINDQPKVDALAKGFPQLWQADRAMPTGF